jgi:hypothetical protein
MYGKHEKQKQKTTYNKTPQTIEYFHICVVSRVFFLFHIVCFNPATGVNIAIPFNMFKKKRKYLLICPYTYIYNIIF